MKTNVQYIDNDIMLTYYDIMVDGVKYKAGYNVIHTFLNAGIHTSRHIDSDVCFMIEEGTIIPFINGIGFIPDVDPDCIDLYFFDGNIFHMKLDALDKLISEADINFDTIDGSNISSYTKVSIRMEALQKLITSDKITNLFKKEKE